MGPDLGSSLFTSSTTLFLWQKRTKISYFQVGAERFSWRPFCIPDYSGLKYISTLVFKLQREKSYRTHSCKEPLSRKRPLVFFSKKSLFIFLFLFQRFFLPFLTPWRFHWIDNSNEQSKQDSVEIKGKYRRKF